MTEPHFRASPTPDKPAEPSPASTTAYNRPAKPGKGKPAKPNPEYPLTAHPAGYWCKKIRGKLHYFGPWSDPDGALKKYEKERQDLHAGRKPKEEVNPASATVKDVANTFLRAKKDLVDGGELSPRTFTEYRCMSDELVAHAGKNRLVSDLDAGDFADLRKKLAKRWGPHRLKKAIQYIRSIFKHAYDSGLIDRPMRFGPEFKRPSMKTLRLHKAKQGAKLFTAEEVRSILNKADSPIKAMLLLGINCGFGNADCGTLPRAALDLDQAWIDYPRPKTGIPRRCPLWPETVQAIREALDKRPRPKKPEHANLVFITKYGHSWGKDTSDSPITKETRKLLDAMGINGHRNFYTLRHTFRTIADSAKDQPAADYIMGHYVPHMSSIYRETIDDDRLRVVSDHVRKWLLENGEVVN